MSKQAEAKRDGVINPQNYNLINLNTEKFDALKRYESTEVKEYLTRPSTVSCWFVVYTRMFIYNFLNVCPFDYTAVAGSGKVGPVTQVNHTRWVAVVTLTDRP